MNQVSKPWLAALLLTLVAALVTTFMPNISPPDDESADLLPANKPARPPMDESTLANRFVRALYIPAKSTSTAEAFGEQPEPERATPPPPPPVVSVVVEEQAPEEPRVSVPFVYLGQLQDETATTTAFLQLGGDAVAVATGERINNQWQLDDITHDTLVFRHLPSQQLHTLRTDP